MASEMKDFPSDNMEEEEAEEEEEEQDEEEEVTEKAHIVLEETPKTSKEKPKGKKAGRTVLSGRGVTLKMLVDDGILNVENGCMSIDYLVRIWCNIIFFDLGMVGCVICACSFLIYLNNN